MTKPTWIFNGTKSCEGTPKSLIKVSQLNFCWEQPQGSNSPTCLFDLPNLLGCVKQARQSYGRRQFCLKCERMFILRLRVQQNSVQWCYPPQHSTWKCMVALISIWDGFPAAAILATSYIDTVLDTVQRTTFSGGFASAVSLYLL